MPRHLPEAFLAYFTKTAREGFRDIERNAQNASDSAYLQHLLGVLTTDRIELAQDHLGAARKATRSRPGHPRAAISRAYYAMYQALRAVVFFVQHGDVSDHSRLPSEIPKDFPDRSRWANCLKDARLLRNDVDYSPYPKDVGDLSGTATSVCDQAQALISECERYLRTKGWAP